MEYNSKNFDHGINLEDLEVEYNDIIKTVFVGDSGVGKTNILYVFAQN